METSLIFVHSSHLVKVTVRMSRNLFYIGAIMLKWYALKISPERWGLVCLVHNWNVMHDKLKLACLFAHIFTHQSVHVHIHMHLLMTYWPFSSLQMILAFPVLPFILKVTVESWLPFMSPSGRVIQWTSSFLHPLTYCWEKRHRLSVTFCHLCSAIKSKITRMSS